MAHFRKSKLFNSNERLFIFCCLPVFTLLFLLVNISQGISQENEILKVETIEYPGTDPVKKENRLLVDMADFLDERGKGIRTTGKLHNKPVEDVEGNIYYVSMCNGRGPKAFDFTGWKGGHWIKYDPKTDKIEDMGLVDQGIGCYPLTIDKKNGYLFGIGFTGYFYRFDLKTRVTKNLGRVSNWDICRKIFCDDEGNVYMSFPTV